MNWKKVEITKKDCHRCQQMLNCSIEQERSQYWSDALLLVLKNNIANKLSKLPNFEQ